MRLVASTAAALMLAACSTPPRTEIHYDIQPVDGVVNGTGEAFCTLGTAVPGAVVPVGTCIRRFASVGAPRVMAFAPNGDLFVAAPSSGTPGGAPSGPGAIVVLSDDDHDGVGELHTFEADLPDVHGLAFANGALYFTTGDSVWREPYAPGQRRGTGGATVVGTFEPGPSSMRWTHGLGASPNGTVYATQGTYSSSMCPDSPRTGAVSRLATNTAAMQLLSSGYRNPLYMRCHYRDEACLVAELGDDGGGGFGAHEKIVLLRPDTTYGYPCCNTTGSDTPYNFGAVNCSGVTREEATFPLNDTPFGLDWERGVWPQPFHNALFVALHGSFYSNPQWQGSRVVFATTDPATHVPSGPWLDFVLGFGPGGSSLQRATDVAFAPDGRLFLSDDEGGAIYWIAPEGLRRQVP